ncbi:MAG TPA: hypothetical protein VLQ80_28120 [Candidatus Saccharimonadia bacterium]|nr:hypothetical protein [Candidatus Saccharimonadia bacterium]
MATDGVQPGRAKDLPPEQAQPGSDWRQSQSRGERLTPVGLPNQEPHRQQRQHHGMMPALPGAHLVRVHPHLALAAFATRFHAGPRLDDPRSLGQRRLFPRQRGPSRRREIVMVALARSLIGGSPRGARLQRPGIHQGPAAGDEPCRRSAPLALAPRLHPALDHRHCHWPLLPVADCHGRPRIATEGFPPCGHRGPRGRGTAATP